MSDRGLSWYKRDPIAFLDGVQGLGPELIGAYAVIIDLLYARAGATPRDDHHLAGIMGCSKRKAKALTDSLIAAGKITVQGGFITQNDLQWRYIANGRVPLSGEVRWYVFERDGGACVYCGETDGPFEIDHVRPLARGGSDDIENLALSCRACNRSKGAKTLDEWRGCH